MEYSILKSLNRPFLSLQNLGWCLCGFSFDWLLKLFTQLRWSICMSEPLRTSIRVRVSADFILARHSSPHEVRLMGSRGSAPYGSWEVQQVPEKQRKGGRLSSKEWVFRPYTQLRWSICTSEPLRTSIRVSPDVILARHSSPSFGSQHLCLPPFLSLFSTVVSVQNMLPYIGNGWKGGNLEGILWRCDAQNTKFNSQYLCHHRSYKGSENLQQTQQQHHFWL